MNVPDPSPSIPGLRLATVDGPTGPRFVAQAHGLLASKASAGGWACHAEGLMRAAPRGAADVLARFLEGGEPALAELVRAGGSFVALLVRDDGQRALALADLLTTRPLYLHHHAGRSHVAPAPSVFADLGLPMSLDRTTLVAILELLHPVSSHMLCAEVSRLRPGELVTLTAGAPPRASTLVRFTVPPAPDPPDDVATWADRLTAIVADGLRLAIDDPRLSRLPIHLPLTAGLDSRHLLGELLRMGRPPALLHHVILDRRDHRPVVAMAERFGLPLHHTALADIDHRAAFHRWLERCAGVVNAHQLYLFDLLAGLAPGVPGQAVGFDGLGMDRLLGVQFVLDLPDDVDPIARLFSKAYTPASWLLRLAPDAPERHAEAVERMRAIVERIDGPPWYRMTLADTCARLVHHSGGTFPAYGDEALYFAPGADARAVDFFLRAPRAVVGLKAARLDALRRHFPELAAFPGLDGVPVKELDHLEKPRRQRGLHARRMLGWALRGFRGDRAPETEHAWLRQIPYWRRAAARLASDSALAVDGHVPGETLAAMWHKHRRGGWLAWPIISLIGVELGYRRLVRRESARSILAWLEG